MAIKDLPLGQRLSTQMLNKRVRLLTSALELQHLITSYPPQTLQIYADLAHRAMRRDLLKPRIQENDFSEVENKRDGGLTVHNSRFKTRIRPGRQVHRT